MKNDSCDWEPANNSALYLEVKRRVIELSLTYNMVPTAMSSLSLKEMQQFDNKITRITVEFLNLLNTGRCVRIIYDPDQSLMVASLL